MNKTLNGKKSQFLLFYFLLAWFRRSVSRSLRCVVFLRNCVLFSSLGYLSGFCLCPNVVLSIPLFLYFIFLFGGFCRKYIFCRHIYIINWKTTATITSELWIGKNCLSVIQFFRPHINNSSFLLFASLNLFISLLVWVSLRF